MGFVRIKARVWSLDRPSDVREIELLAATGSVYAVLPSGLLRKLGVNPIGVRRFRLLMVGLLRGRWCCRY
ncbi:hypothetical protein [Caldivirga sp.]|uniref:hypothetical protein n=1 Tax=Caldivirga sp. TaxID=2080243 RepID=UPI003D0D4BBC